MIDPDCHYGDHTWRGSSQCVRCGARLRCFCGAFVRADNMERHLDTRCRWAAKWAVAGSDDLVEVSA